MASSRASSLRFLGIWLFFALMYTLISTWMRSNGYLSWEGLFISQKLELIFEPEIDKLKLFVFIYPVLTFFASLPGAVISYIEAPYFTSILLTSLFAAFAVNSLVDKRGPTIVWSTVLYLLVSPVFLFAAVSGTSFYAYILGYFLVFYYLFHYVDDVTTYRLTMLGLVLMFMTFVNYRILWLFVFLIPLVYILTILSANHLHLSIPGKLERIYTTAALRRKFLGRAFAMMVVVGFLPMMSFLLYVLLNRILTGNAFFFEDNVTSQWSSYVEQSFISFKSLTDKRLASTNDPYFYAILLLLFPMYLYQFIRKTREFFKVAIFLTIPLVLLFFFRSEHFELINLNYFSVFIACGMAAGVMYKPRERYRRLNQYIWPIVLGLAVIGEWVYFSQSSYRPEKSFYQAARYQESDKMIKSLKHAAAYIDKRVEPTDQILCDEAIFYPLMAFTEDQSKFLHTFDNTYYTALQNPSLYTKYLVLSASMSPLYNWDVIRFYEENFNSEKGYHLTPVYSNPYLYLVKIVPDGNSKRKRTNSRLP